MVDYQALWIPFLLTLLAGMSTGIGSIFSLFIKEFKKKYLNFAMGLSAGVMVYVGFVELLGGAVDKIGFLKGNIAFFCGIGFIMLIDFLIPHEYIEEKVEGKNKKIMSAGIFTALGIAIHNLPEGLAVFMSSLGDVNLGISLAFAIALHNIPEGIAVAMPIYYATKSKAKAFWYSFLSGIAEPIGALIGVFFLLPYLNDVFLAYCLAFVGGIMIFISFDELLPLSFQEDHGHGTVAGIFIGMTIMAISLSLI